MTLQVLTEAEIERVSGGDASRTHARGQNAWGEHVPWGYFHYSTAAADAVYRQWAADLDTQCRTLVVPWITCQQAALAHMISRGFSNGRDLIFENSQ